MTNLQNLSVAQLRSIVSIKEEIERLEAKLESITGESAPAPAVPGKRTMSASARARIAAAQRRRWAKVKRNGGAAKAKAKTVGKRKVDSATRSKLAAIARARWAKRKAAGQNKL